MRCCLPCVASAAEPIVHCAQVPPSPSQGSSPGRATACIRPASALSKPRPAQPHWRSCAVPVLSRVIGACEAAAQWVLPCTKVLGLPFKPGLKKVDRVNARVRYIEGTDRPTAVPLQLGSTRRGIGSGHNGLALGTRHSGFSPSGLDRTFAQGVPARAASARSPASPGVRLGCARRGAGRPAHRGSTPLGSLPESCSHLWRMGR